MRILALDCQKECRVQAEENKGRARAVAQQVECLTSMPEALVSVFRPA